MILGSLLSIPGFTPVSWLGFVLLGFGLLIHITLVNVVLGMSVIVPITEFIGYRRKDNDLESLARRLFRYLALSDLIAGVFGTWVAVMLAAFWPKLLYIFSTILLAPIILALLGIFMAIPAIAIYWYGWNRMPKKIHLVIGAFMAVGALLVPAGFRVLFAFIDAPGLFNVSLQANSIVGTPNLLSLLTNPLYVTLLFHSWFGGLTMSALFAAGAFGWAVSGNLRKRERLNLQQPDLKHFSPDSMKQMPFYKTRTAIGLPNKPVIRTENDDTISVSDVHGIDGTDTEEITREFKFVNYLLTFGLIFLLIQSATGVVYFFTLEKYSPYIYASITGNTSIAAYNFSPLFVAFLLFVILIWLGAIALFYNTRRSRKIASQRWASFILMLSTAVALPLGEALNDSSRAPYMIVSGTTGIGANSLTNSILPITWPVAVMAVLVGILTVTILLATLYLVFVRKK